MIEWSYSTREENESFVATTTPDFKTSPFRAKASKGGLSETEAKAIRKAGALRMIELREKERELKVEALARYAKLGLGKAQLRVVEASLLALANNIRSWQQYINDGCPHVPGATEIPGVTR